VACEVLLCLGFDVFRNVSQRGAHDIAISLPTGRKALLIDVTLGTWKSKVDGGRFLASAAPGKLHSGRCACVLAVTVDREIFVADYDTERGTVYEGAFPYAVIYSPFTVESFSRRIS
jgi:hypothetical protein